MGPDAGARLGPQRAPTLWGLGSAYALCESDEVTTTPTLCSECGGSLLAVMTQVLEGPSLQKHLHYRCQDLACVAHREDAS